MSIKFQILTTVLIFISGWLIGTATPIIPRPFGEIAGVSLLIIWLIVGNLNTFSGRKINE